VPQQEVTHLTLAGLQRVLINTTIVAIVITKNLVALSGTKLTTSGVFRTNLEVQVRGYHRARPGDFKPFDKPWLLTTGLFRCLDRA
jgi:hypothetical protein